MITQLTGFGELFGSMAKIIIVIFLLVYSVFSFLVSRQVNLMVKTLEVGFESALKIIAVIHMGVSIILLIGAILLL